MSADLSVSEMSMEEAKAELDRLHALIEKADKAYYRDDAPEISDAEYDAARTRYTQLETEFPELRRMDSVSDRVGAAPAEGFTKVRHSVPMLSLGNAFDDEDVADFVQRGRKFFERDKGLELAFTAEPKIDGFPRRCAMRMAFSCVARPAETARWVRTSRKISGPLPRYLKSCWVRAGPRCWKCAARSI